MKNNTTPWDQRIARIIVKPLAKTPITPNQLSFISLVIALIGAGLISTGDTTSANLGAGLFAFSRFLDHFDGELARFKSMTSKLGYLIDYYAGACSYSVLFLCMGIGFRNHQFGNLAILLGCIGCIASIISLFANLRVDKEMHGEETVDAVGYPGFAGFELEDGIYLIAPVTWLGYLFPFFVAAALGSIVYTAWTVSLTIRRRQS